MLWDALGRSGTLWGRLWDALGRSGTLWDALGGSETFWEALVRSGDVLGCSEALWDAGMFGDALGQAPGLSATLWRRSGDALGRNHKPGLIFALVTLPPHEVAS